MKRCVCGTIIALALALCACGRGPEKGAAVEATALPVDTAAPTAATAVTPAPVVAVAIEAPKATMGPTGIPTHTPAPTDTPAPTPAPTPDCLHGAAHPDVFAVGEAVKTDMAYTSDKVSIQIKKIENPDGFPKPMVCYVADIWIEDITSFRTAWSESTLNASNSNPRDVLDLMAREEALLMINGDYISKWNFGCVVSNGKVARTVDNPRYDACVLLRDGTLLTIDGDKAKSEDIVAMDPWQAWCFGPVLLDENGKARTKFNSSLTGTHPRTVLGYYAPGHYCFVVVDGRRDKYSKGMTYAQLAKFMESLGCAAAYNMDGGGSSVMAFDGRRVSKPSDFRAIPDVIYICEPRKEN